MLLVLLRSSPWHCFVGPGACYWEARIPREQQVSRKAVCLNLTPLPRREGIRACRMIPRGMCRACFTQKFSLCSDGPKTAAHLEVYLFSSLSAQWLLHPPCRPRRAVPQGESRCSFPRAPKGTGRAICLHKFPLSHWGGCIGFEHMLMDSVAPHEILASHAFFLA